MNIIESTKFSFSYCMMIVGRVNIGGEYRSTLKVESYITKYEHFSYPIIFLEVLVYVE